MSLDVAPAPSLTPLELESFFEVIPNRPNRKLLVQQPKLKVLHLTLAPGQALPLHKHPGCYVLLQGLTGTTTVQLEQEVTTLSPRHLLGFSGETRVSIRNGSDAPSALLITLAEGNERKNHEDPPAA